jgi:hypothetical protein
MSLAKKSVTKFLNVDLDLRTRHGLEELLTHLEPRAFVLQRTEQFACLELNEDTKSLEETVLGLVELVQSFAPQAREKWNQCDSRTFSIGIQAGSEPQQAHFTLSSKALSLLAGIQADVTLTVYAPYESQ